MFHCLLQPHLLSELRYGSMTEFMKKGTWSFSRVHSTHNQARPLISPTSSSPACYIASSSSTGSAILPVCHNSSGIFSFPVAGVKWEYHFLDLPSFLPEERAGITWRHVGRICICHFFPRTNPVGVQIRVLKCSPINKSYSP